MFLKLISALNLGFFLLVHKIHVANRLFNEAVYIIFLECTSEKKCIIFYFCGEKHVFRNSLKSMGIPNKHTLKSNYFLFNSFLK